MTPLDTVGSSDNLSLSSDSLRGGHNALRARFAHVRSTSRRLAAQLSPEDMVAQSMPDASPAKWHLAHTAWFFETFFLLPRGAEPFDPAFQYQFNSYYEALGERQPRAARGLITRPGAAEVMAYRDHVDAAMDALLAHGALSDADADLVTLGLAHEEQHQELLLTDVLHLFAQNRLKPAYAARASAATAPSTPRIEAATFSAFAGGVVEVGHDGRGFAFDNEGPRHQVLLRPYELADRLVTNAEWRLFMDDGGYDRADLWLSDGWACRQAQNWSAPLYWERAQEGWSAFGPYGLEALRGEAPVTHISFYEADAFARWSGCRLPLEAEWEHAASGAGHAGAFLDDWGLEPRSSPGGALAQMFGDVWEWTASAYLAYPGFKAAPGAVGEYNGKFMINQMVLKGGSCATASGHVRPSYRNFFQPHQRWQFSGLRLARD